MILKNFCQCAINVQIIVHICVVINARHVIKTMFFHLFHSVCGIYKTLSPVGENNFIFFLVEILPLVAFYPESDIGEAEAERLLMAPTKSNAIHLDPFTDTMIHEDMPDTLPMTLDRESLRAIDPSTVLIVKWRTPLRTKYYRNLLPDLQISICPECLQVSESCERVFFCSY